MACIFVKQISQKTKTKENIWGKQNKTIVDKQ